MASKTIAGTTMTINLALVTTKEAYMVKSQALEVTLVTQKASDLR